MFKKVLDKEKRSNMVACRLSNDEKQEFNQCLNLELIKNLKLLDMLLRRRYTNE